MPGEMDPYSASYGSRVKDSTHQAAAKRLRKESMVRGNHIRQVIEARAPRWKNMSPGGPVSFQPKSRSGVISLKRGS